MWQWESEITIVCVLCPLPVCHLLSYRFNLLIILEADLFPECFFGCEITTLSDRSVITRLHKVPSKASAKASTLEATLKYLEEAWRL